MGAVSSVFVKGVSLCVCFEAFEHFRVSKHGFVNVDARSVDFASSALHCGICRDLLMDIDLLSLERVPNHA